MSRSTTFDLVVIGGGINGCGIAADAAGRGLAVLLAEQGDLAGGTSSASSKLIHGGLRYLEHYEFRLVREALGEREVLLGLAPHIVWPLRFLLPHVPGVPGQRPAWMIRAGLFLYDHLARRRRIPGSGAVALRAEPAAAALKPELERGFCYWDCWVDDARLVVLNARAAARRGAEILTRTPVTALVREAGLWRVRLGGDVPREVVARAVVNAAGPWAEAVARLARPEAGPASSQPPAATLAQGRSAADEAAPLRLRLVRGSHIVVPRLPGATDAFLLQSPDGRVVFALPFEGVFTLIGTTDVPHTDGLLHVEATEQEIDYLLGVVNSFLRTPLGRDAILWTFAGIRPLDDADGVADPSAVTRDWRLALDDGGGDGGGSGDVHGHAAPLLHVVGGKITTYRRLAEAAVDRLAPFFPEMSEPWTAHAALPGGDLGGLDGAGYAAALASLRPGLPADLVRRIVRRHGSDTAEILGDARSPADLGEHFGGALYAREVAFLRDNEWARTADDVLWRRTRAGLHIPVAARAAAAERLSRLL